MQDLVKSERRWKKESTEWQRKVAQWSKWKDGEKSRKREEDKAKRTAKKKDDDTREDPAERRTWESSFDPDGPLPEFSFAGAYSRSELDEELGDLWNVDSWLIDAALRGIAVHHAGMNKSYRSLAEKYVLVCIAEMECSLFHSLFRRGIIRVMISTGTLALGINAPTRTSVFCGDSPYLTALMVGNDFFQRSTI